MDTPEITSADRRKSLQELRCLERKNAQTRLVPPENARWHELYLEFITYLYDVKQPAFENRQYIRIPVKRSGQLRDEDKCHPIAIRDICMAGACILYDTDLQPKAISNLEFKLQHLRWHQLFVPQTLELQAKLIWHAPEMNRIGFKFINTTPRQRHLLENEVFRSLSKLVNEEVTPNQTSPLTETNRS
ncbi:MAG: PilZ domain-containing protein [Myxococcota bacterium]|nr:PilZ domain-containing protein [Myxococcota bacterium]